MSSSEDFSPVSRTDASPVLTLYPEPRLHEVIRVSLDPEEGEELVGAVGEDNTATVRLQVDVSCCFGG
jgi:hypothetical protein